MTSDTTFSLYAYKSALSTLHYLSQVQDRTRAYVLP